MDNIVFDNYNGLVGSGTFTSNRSYDNIASGLSVGGNSTVVGNQIYDNAIGIQGSASGGGVFTNNLIYANTTLGVGIHGTYGILFANNTVYDLTGDALAVDSSASSVQIKSNILWAVTGTDITVAPDSEIGFTSDYNDLVTAGGNVLGHWEGRNFSNRIDWFYELNLDQHSITTDPQFVNPAGADGVIGYSNAPSGSAQIFDDSDPSFQTTGSWTTVSSAGVGGSDHQSDGSGGDTATWTLSGLTPGKEYQIAVTWPVSSFSGPTRYTVLDTGAVSGSVDVYQTSAPSDFTASGVPWKVVGTFFATTSTLVVTEIQISFVHPFVADAVRVQAIQGDAGTDDNFHVQSTSATIDAGDPMASYVSEPTPSGGRVNQGFDGNTAGAAPSPIQFLQETVPAGQEKFQVGQAVPITWRSVGINAPAGYYSSEVLADNPVAYYRLGEPTGATAAADASGHGAVGTYVSGVTLGLEGALGSDSDTAAGLTGGAYNAAAGYVQLPAGFADFHNGFSFEAWAFPTSVAGNQPIFDFGNGYNSDNIVLGREGTTNNLIFQVFSGGAPGPVVRATGALDLNVWQQFAVTEDSSGNVILYKNGQVIGTGTTTLPQNVIRADNYLGKSNLDNPFFAGSLDEAAVFNSVLPAARILDHYNHASFGTVNIDLLRDGDPRFVQHLAVDAVDNGLFNWTIPANQPLANDYRIRIEASEGIMPQVTTPETFLITNSGHNYYVNDNSTAGDVFTTAVGNNANSGKSPDQPVASLPALLTAYTFGPGDVIHVDTGTYDLIKNVRLSPSDSGVTIVGPTTGTGTALFNRGNTNSGAFTFELAGATDVTLDHLGITGGYAGVEANDTGSQRLTVSNSDIYGNADFGIQTLRLYPH